MPRWQGKGCSLLLMQVRQAVLMSSLLVRLANTDPGSACTPDGTVQYQLVLEQRR